MKGHVPPCKERKNLRKHRSLRLDMKLTAVMFTLWFSAVNADGEKKPMPPPYVPPPPPDDEEHVFETLTKGINFDKYDAIPVECTGRDAPQHGLSRSAFLLLVFSHLFIIVCCHIVAILLLSRTKNSFLFFNNIYYRNTKIKP